MSDFALDKLRALGDRVAPEERTPELQLLLRFADVSREADERLKDVAARRGEGVPVEELLAAPETFQGLALFVRAVALGAEAAGVGLCSAEVLTLLKESLLQPLVAQGPEGAYQAHRPSVVCPQPTPLNILQLLASGVFLHITDNAEPGIAMLSAALSGVWPPQRSMQRRLVAAQFVPSAEGGGDGREAGSQGSAGAGAQDGKQEGFSGAASSTEGGKGTGSAAAEGSSGADEGAAAREAAADTRPTPMGAAMAAALAERCPGLSLADLEKAALVLRLFLGCRTVGQQAGGGASFQAVVRTLLLDCQQLLDLDPACMHAYVWACQLVLYARWPLDARRVRALFEEGLRRGREAQCWLAVGEVAHDYAMWQVSAAGSERNVAVRQAALLEAGKLLGAVEEAEGQLAGWLPSGRLLQLTARRQQLGQLLQQLQAGKLRTMGAPRPGGSPACGFCGQAAAPLRTCGTCKSIAYCSRDCQVKDWKAGHKQRCAELAAVAGASGGGGAAEAQGGEAAAALG